MATWAWGFNGTNGILGIGTTTTNVTTPTSVAGGVDFISAFSIGTAGSVFIAVDRTVYVTGSNTFGTWGNGTTGGSPRTTPVQVSGLSNIVKVNGDNDAAAFYALEGNGTLWGWGHNANGQFGLGNTTAHSTPTQLRTDVVDFASGNGHVIALTNTGAVVTAGYNAAGQLATGTDGGGTSTGSPPGEYHSWQTVTPSGTVVQVAAGDNVSLVRRSDGSVLGAGYNGASQLGFTPAGGFHNTWTTLAFTNSVDILCGQQATFSLRNDGTFWGMGNNSGGQLGSGSTSPSISATPLQMVVPGGVSIVDVSISWVAVTGAFLGSNSQIYTWGGGSSGQMGNGTTTTSNPTPISGNGLTSQVWLVAGGFAMWAGDQFALVTARPRAWAAVIG